ncbi:hypothetical protein L6164_033409 [Bauhinia variegata]|uniref:Uncharacterized protein n=1 Tax=Bauhinia variegata TaxID=167791 RepID=A0ACB9KRJ9_BAUVA|nr:hypothetical protein L6164_033409 [Bauhinia variegata]
MPLVFALIERWRPKTHTFHLLFRKCTITLQDVAMLLGLPIDGDLIQHNTPPFSKFAATIGTPISAQCEFRDLVKIEFNVSGQQSS